MVLNMPPIVKRKDYGLGFNLRVREHGQITDEETQALLLSENKAVGLQARSFHCKIERSFTARSGGGGLREDDHRV